MRTSFLTLVAGLIVLVAPQATASGQDRVCTAIGCSSGLTVSLEDQAGKALAPLGSRITLCLDDLCRSYRARGAFVQLERPEQSSPGPVRVRLVLRDRKERVIRRLDREVLLSRFEPNGPECGPTCWIAGYQLQSDRRFKRTR